MKREFFSRIYFGKMQSHRALTILPVMLPYSVTAIRYLTLPEALERKSLKLEDSCEDGGRKNLKLANTGDCPVLLLEGEELAAAGGQQRIDSSFLVASTSTVTIPVSARGPDRVTHDASIEENTRKRQLEEAVTGFPLVRGQCGLLAFVNKQIIGMEWMSQAEKYAFHHSRLLRMCLHGCLDQSPVASDPKAIYSAADMFLEKLARAKHDESVTEGLGEVYSITAGSIRGTCLVYQGEPLHSRYISTDGQQSNRRRGICCYYLLS